MIHVMLPTQYLNRAAAGANEGHKRLMAAVLQTVVDDCRGSTYWRSRNYGRPVSRRNVEKATAYMTSGDRVWPFSFNNLCDALGLDPGRLRKELQSASCGPTIAPRRTADGGGRHRGSVTPSA